jgi:Glutathione S-transferase
MAEFELDGFSESGNSFKAALMLELCGADWQVRRVAFFSGETRSPAYRERNVMGEAPVLVHHRADGDFTLPQSGAILEYLADHFGRFAPETEKEKYDILRWLLWDNHKLTSYTATYRFQTFFLKKVDAVSEFFHARAKSAWKVLESHLEDHTFLVGERPTIADLSACAYLLWPDQIGMDRSDYPNIAAWLGRIEALPRFKRAEELMPSGQDPITATA